MKGIYEIRKSNVLQILKFMKRKELAALMQMDVGLLNQYLREKNPKNFGEITIDKITNALNLPSGYLDHLHDESTFNFMLGQGGATSDDANISQENKMTNNNKENQFRILKVRVGLIISKEKNLEITHHLAENSSVHFPDNIKNPIAFLMTGNTKRLPYKNGWIIICEQNSIPVAGEEALIFTKNEKIYAGEVLFKKDNFIEIEDIFGERESIDKDEIKQILPIKVYVAPSQKVKNSY